MKATLQSIGTRYNEGGEAVERYQCGAGAGDSDLSMTIEEMSAAYFDSEALIEPPYRLWQLNSGGQRYYYRYNEEGEAVFYPSVTTILKDVCPMSPHLLEWMLSTGKDEAARQRDERAAYGTFMHAQFQKVLIERQYDFDNLRSELCAYIEAERLPGDFIHHADELKKDVLSFVQFIIDYDVRPYAVEVALTHPVLGYAGMVDCACSMKKNPGSDERIDALIDFKSGRKGFYEEHELQLHLYRYMWNVNFDERRIAHVFNFSPTNWRKRPSYKLKNQTMSAAAAAIPALLELAKLKDKKRSRAFTCIVGSVNLDAEHVDVSDNIVSLSMAELVKNRNKQEERMLCAAE